MKQKIISIAAALALCLSLLPGTALAAEAGYKTQRTSQLHISSLYDSQDKLATEGWKWDKENLTLTLNGLDINCAGNQSAIYYNKLYSPSITIILEGQNRIYTGGSGIYVNTALNIEGSGTLEIKYGDSGISADKLTVSGVTINAVSTNQTKGNTSEGISGSTGITIQNSSVTVESPYGRGLVSSNGDISISNSTVDTGKCKGYGIFRKTSNTVGSITFDQSSNVTGLLVEGDYGRATVKGTVSSQLRTAENFASLTVEQGAEWTILAGGSQLEVRAGQTLTNCGTINAGRAVYLYGGTMENAGTVNGSVYVYNGGTLTNTANGNMRNSTVIVSGGSFTNQGIGPEGKVATWDALWLQLSNLPQNAADPTQVKLTADLENNDNGQRQMRGKVKAVVDVESGGKTISTGTDRTHPAVVLSDGAELTLKNVTLQSKGPAPMFHVTQGTLTIGEGTTFTSADGDPHYIHVNRPTVNGSQNSNGNVVIDRDFTSGETLNIYVNQLETFLTEDMLGDPGQLGMPNVPEGTVVATATDGHTLSLDNIRLVEKVYTGSTPSMKVVPQGGRTEWGQYLALSEDGRSVIIKVMYWPVLKNNFMSAVGQPDQPLKDFLIDAVVTDQFGRVVEGTWSWKTEDGTDASDAVPEADGSTAYIAKFVPAEEARSEFCETPLTVKIVPVVREVVRVSGVTLSQSALTLEQGGETTLTATVSPDNAAIKSVTWASSNPGVAVVDSDGRVAAVGIGTAVITVTTTDGDKTASCTVTVIPQAIHVTGVTMNKTELSLTVGGSELLTAIVAPSDASNKTMTWTSSDPTIATVDSSGNVTAVGAGTATITVTTADGGKTASCTVTVKTNSSGSGTSGSGSSGGGSSSGGSSTAPSLPVTTEKTTQGGVSATETTAKPSATTSGGTAESKVSTSIGDEIVKQAETNRSDNVVIAPEIRGDVTRTEVSIPAGTVEQIGSKTEASLTVSTPVAAVTIPNEALSGLSREGGSVKVTAQRTENTVELSVTAGGRTVDSIPGGVTVTVPVEETKPGTVAVLVKEDGTRQVIRKSAVGEDGVTVPLDGSAKIEIVDNSKAFGDVPTDNWAADAVAFTSARELFSGTSDTTFSPDLPMSRGMLAVVLHNLESNPDAALSGAFSDVSNSKWYAEGVSWAAAKGIITGYGNGMFGPDDDITREQLAVMLWRYAGSPAATDKELHFTDAGKASGWALEALRWATENGIINGKGNGILDPGGKATRAETAQMLKNFLESK